EPTYRCPLHCLSCSNADRRPKGATELSTDEWLNVLTRARRLGAMQLHLSGGEPITRPGMSDLVSAAAAGFYTNLVTGGESPGPQRAGKPARAGLDHVQLSIQDSRPPSADRIAGARVVYHKMRA